MPDTTPPTLVLLVLPEEQERRRLAAHLARLSYEVVSAVNGAQGCQLTALDLPALVVADVALPDMDGYTCCRLLKANAATTAVPMILVGQGCTARERVHGLSLGAVDFLSKPYDMDELVARIRVHVGLVPRLAAAGNARAVRGNLDDIAVAVAQRFVEAHLGELPSLPEIARAAGTYRERLNRLFFERFGGTVFDYVRMRRFERAAQLLRETELGIGDVARLVGYPTARNFSTAFRERTGLAPGIWRRQARPVQPGPDETLDA